MPRKSGANSPLRERARQEWLKQQLRVRFQRDLSLIGEPNLAAILALVNLLTCPVGAPVTITSVDLPSASLFRLRELGLAPGTTVTVIQKAAFKGRVVSARCERIAVDAMTARRIAVTQDSSVASTPAEASETTL